MSNSKMGQASILINAVHDPLYKKLDADKGRDFADWFFFECDIIGNFLCWGDKINVCNYPSECN